jgi:hypothetical protein
MKPLKAHEPAAEELALAHRAYDVALVSFNREPEKLESSELLPRYNRVKLKIRCRSTYSRRPLFLTVRRHGSKIGTENFYTVPFFAGDISAGTEAEYELLSFDSFNLPFAEISVEMCQPDDYLKRRVSLMHIERAKGFALPIH